MSTDNRIMRWVMNPLFDKLMVFITVGLAAWAIGTALNTAQRAEDLSESNAAIGAAAALNTDQVVVQARAGCERDNALRESAALMLRQQYNTTQRLIERPGGLAGLEPFRELIERQQRERRRALRLLRLAAKDIRVPGHPDRIDCAKAFPYQRLDRVP